MTVVLSESVAEHNDVIGAVSKRLVCSCPAVCTLNCVSSFLENPRLRSENIAIDFAVKDLTLRPGCCLRGLRSNLDHRELSLNAITVAPESASQTLTKVRLPLAFADEST